MNSEIQEKTLQSINNINSNLQPQSSTQTQFSIFSFNWISAIIIVFILAIFGINIFSYLAKGTDDAATIFNSIFGPIVQVIEQIVKLFAYTGLEVTKKVINVSADGAKAGIDIVDQTSTGAIDAIENATQDSTSSNTIPSLSSKIISNASSAVTATSANETQQDELHHTIQSQSYHNNSNINVVPDDTDSSIQQSGKSGWCYIGTDKGIRACSKIGVNDTCMSGDIYSSKEICVNPELRP